MLHLDKDAAAVREQLEKDLEVTKAQLEAKRASESADLGDQDTDLTAKKSITEIEVCQYHNL